ncbi:MAG: hypothetical protein WC556_05210 [Candidatus Methanoperedens sp.]
MQITNGEKVIFEIPLPMVIENKIDALDALLTKEKKYTWQVLAIIAIIISLIIK